MPGISIGYSGGAVQHHVRVHLIFWGAAWQSSGADLIAAQQRLFGSLDGSSWTAVLQQYRDHHGAAAQDVALVGTWIDRASPPPALHGDLLNAEVIRAAAVNRWDLGPDDQFILYLKAGVDIEPHQPGSCAYHQEGVPSGTGSLFAYAVIASDCPDWALAGVGHLGTVDVLAAHESAEIMIDPLRTSWGAFGVAPLNESEVADLCGYLPPVRVPAGWLPMLFDRSTDTCRAGIGG